MKLLIALVALTFTGCASVSSTLKDTVAVINQLLDQNLSPDFNGPFHLYHKNPYFDITIDVTGLHHDPTGWHWTSLVYHRSDRFSSGDVTVGAK